MKVKLLESQKNIKLSPEENSQFVLVPNGDVDVEITLAKEDVDIDLLVLFSLNGKSEVKLHTKSIHKVPNTSCDVDVKTALFDSGKSEFVGKIIIPKGSKNTNSFLHDEVLSIGSNTKNRSQPILEIEADDVRASHGATTGRVDKGQVYYLMTRGLTEQEAQKTIIEGFFESLIAQIKDEKIQEDVRKKLFSALKNN